MSFKWEKTGDWDLAEKVLTGLPGKIYPAFSAYVDEVGKLFIDTVVGHIDRQDLPWTPLAQRTIEIKGGSTTILVESGFFRDNIKAIKIKQSKDTYDIFVGASDSDYHPSGMSMNDLMVWIEYGTDRMPPRPLIGPSWDEISSKVTKEALDVLKDLVSGR